MSASLPILSAGSWKTYAGFRKKRLQAPGVETTEYENVAQGIIFGRDGGTSGVYNCIFVIDCCVCCTVDMPVY